VPIRVPRSVQPVLTVFATLMLVAILAVVVFLAMLWKYQERIVFQPPGPPYPEAGAARRFDFHAADGQPLLAYFVGDASAGRIIIVFHGNADLAVWQIPWATEVASRTGYAVLLPELRGYGGLVGVPSYSTGNLDAQASYGLARDSLGFAPDRIVLFGHSLGSAIAAELAREVNAAALVLQSPLTSARDMASRIATPAIRLLWSGIGRVHYDTERLVRTLATPVWVAHGARDTVVPVGMGERVFAAAARKGQFLLVEDAGHNDVEARGGERYWQWLVNALGVKDGERAR
jgi:hypothetical protein